MELFFLSREFSYKHLEWFFTILVYAVLVFLEKWMQKKLEIRGGTQELEVAALAANTNQGVPHRGP